MGHTIQPLPSWSSSNQWAMEVTPQTANNVMGFQKTILYVEGYSWLREGWSAQEEQAKVSLLPH